MHIRLFRLLLESMPAYVWIACSLSMALTILIAFVLYRRYRKTVVKPACWLLFVEYAFFILCITVFCREKHSCDAVDLIPLSSYGDIVRGGRFIRVQAILNVLLFVPLGVLATYVIRIRKCLFMLGLALVFSLSIETMQWIWECGYVETDDVIHNTLGMMIGYGIAVFIGKRRAGGIG